MVNRKGLKALGSDSPEEIIGKTLRIEREAVGYIPQGVVCGVTDDFNYTSMREESIPMIIMQRPLFLHNIMVRLNPDQPRALETFNNVWKEIFPDYPARYAFIGDVYGQIFRNELNAGKLVRIFSLLCLLIANLGLIIYMAFIIKLRTKEIGIRKVNGRPIGRNHPDAEPQLYLADRIGVRGRHSGRLYHPATMAPEFRLQNEPRLVDFRRCRDNRPAPVWDRRLVAKLARGNRQSGECDPERINPGGSVNGPQHPGGNTDSPYDIRDILKVVLRTSPL